LLNKGKEKQFYISEKAKYEQKKSITDSKKILQEAMDRIAREKAAASSPSDQKEDKKEKPKKPTPKPKVVKKPEIPKKETPKKVIPPIEKSKETVEAKKEKDIVVPVPIPPKKGKPELKKEDKAKITVHPTNIEKEEKRKTRPILYLLGATILILLTAFVIYWLHFRETKAIDNVVVKQITPEQKVQAKADSLAAVQLSLKADSIQKAEAKLKAEKQANKGRLYASDINKPVVFVACYAVKKESQAKDYANKLQDMKLKGHYYWIPDIQAQGNNYFKVVVGPFKDIASARKSLTLVQEQINFDAYLITIK